MTLATQPKLLRLLQEQQFERVGGEETIRTDVRVIAATNQDLGRNGAPADSVTIFCIGSGSIRFTIPPLRNRRDDLPLLISYFLTLLSRQFGKRVSTVAPDAMQVLESYPGRAMCASCKVPSASRTSNRPARSSPAIRCPITWRGRRRNAPRNARIAARGRRRPARARRGGPRRGHAAIQAVRHLRQGLRKRSTVRSLKRSSVTPRETSCVPARFWGFRGAAPR